MARSGAREPAATADGHALAARLLTWGLPLLLVVAYVALIASPDLRVASRLIPLTMSMFALLALPLVLPARFAPRWNARTILVLAALLRLLFVTRQPELSDDLYRYLWDGDAVLRGQNPFALAPAEAQPATPELAALRAKVNHPELVTIYPPAAQFLFAAARGVHGGTTGAKLLFSLLDLGACALLLALLRRTEAPTWRLALYAWHPLPVLEIAGSGHIDGAAGVALLAALLLLARSKESRRDAVLAGALFAIAVMIKLLPLVLLPCLLVLAGRRRAALFCSIAVLAMVGLCAPFIPDIARGLGTLSTYAHRWEFGSWGFRTLRQLTASGDLARRVLAVLYAVIWLVASIWLFRRVRLEEAPAIRLRLVLRTAYVVVLAFLLLTPTLNPWYALPLVALLPLVFEPLGGTLSATVFIGYTVLPRFARTGEWIESDAAARAIFFVPMLALIAFLGVQRLRRDRSLRG